MAVEESKVNGGYDADLTALNGSLLREHIRSACAHWVTRDTILWPTAVFADGVYTLHYDLAADLHLQADQVIGGKQIPLHFHPAGAAQVLGKFPHLRGHAAFKLDPDHMPQVAEALKGQLVVTARNGQGQLVGVTGLQIPGVLDDLFAYDGDLGVLYADGVPTVRVWAPTAQSVTLRLYPDAKPATTGTPVPMSWDPTTGVWSVTGTPEWTNCFYLYEATVFAPTTGKIERNVVTDPYSISLSTNSTRSQIVDLADPALMPAGWQALHKPPLWAPEDIVLYEMHVRDFSISDQTVAPELRGTYRAFTAHDSNGMRHLRGLAEAGLTHIHLLPVFDIASIDENPLARVEPDPARLASYPPDSDQQQAAIMAVRQQDGFNWGYDPYHYTTPEGSYATDPNGSARIREFREMVQALNDAGLRVVMDVVYNHTYASGQHPKSVLDKLVPGYYHRLNGEGVVERSTCCDNTATEHHMMEKLMIDSLRTWATAYKVDGFRFDLMGHHMLANMLKARDSLATLTPAEHGVDGSKIYLYGEGWNFGEVAYGARGENAAQLNMAGTGIGTFSDRLRDAVRGGSAFSGLHEQGFATGLYTAPNDSGQNTHEYQRGRLLVLMDQIRVALAGTLRDYELTDLSGRRVRGHEVGYNGQPAGYVADPQEVINYIEAHDNETFWDAIQLKAPSWASVELRTRMQMLGNSLVCLAQGVPFFHAGQDLLRSKSLDRNSYDSGDWFNKLDWTYETNNWGIGLPPGDNHHHWHAMRPLLGNPALKPGRADIERTAAHFKEMLRIRKSSKLFRLETAAEIQAKVRFLNTGSEQIPGLIVMHLADAGPNVVDDRFAHIVVLFNATLHEQWFHEHSCIGAAFELHPAHVSGSIASSAVFEAGQGIFKVPSFTTAVFVLRKAAAT